MPTMGAQQRLGPNAQRSMRLPMASPSGQKRRAIVSLMSILAVPQSSCATMRPRKWDAESRKISGRDNAPVGDWTKAAVRNGSAFDKEARGGRIYNLGAERQNIDACRGLHAGKSF